MGRGKDILWMFGGMIVLVAIIGGLTSLFGASPDNVFQVTGTGGVQSYSLINNGTFQLTPDGLNHTCNSTTEGSIYYNDTEFYYCYSTGWATHSGGGSDTNETTRVNQLFSFNTNKTNTDCSAGNYQYGTETNGSPKCRTDVSGGGGSGQWVLASSNWLWNNSNTLDYNTTKGSATYIDEGQYPNLDTDSTDDFDGAWSSLTGIPAGFSDNIDNNTWNSTSEIIEAANTTGYLINWSEEISLVDTNCSTLGSCSSVAYMDYSNTGNFYSPRYNSTGSLGFNFYDDGSELTMNMSEVTDTFKIETDNARFDIYNDPSAGNDYKTYEFFTKKGTSETSFIIYQAGAERSGYYARSFRIGGSLGSSCANMESGVLNYVDCNTSTTGADFLIQDDLWLGGSIYGNGSYSISDTGLGTFSDLHSTDWTNISITEFQINNLNHYTDADIDGSETAFNGWDKDETDDFDGSWENLSGIPAGFDDDIDNDSFSGIEDNSSNWNLAYTWGDHSLVGYISFDSNASTICSGTTTYLDGEGNCDDISTVYEGVLTDEASLYSTLSDVSEFIETNDAATLLTLNTGQGANELYDMDQNVLTTSAPTFESIIVDNVTFTNDSTNHAISDNSTCIIIRGDTSVWSIC